MQTVSETRRDPMSSHQHNFCGRTRREFLWQSGAGFGGAALTGMLGDDFFAKQTLAADGSTPFANPLAPKDPMHPAKAKAVIFLFMYGGPSHMDTFDYKPDMEGRDNQTVAVKTFGRGGHKNEGRIVEPRWKFKQYGECGKWVSDLFPHTAKHVDEIAFLHSMTADSPIHGSALLMMNSGRILSGSPCMGSWVTYGLGSENENLPGFVVMLDHSGGPISGPKNWSSGFMPATYQATVLRSKGEPILDLAPPEGLSMQAQQRRMLDTLREYNEDHADARGGNSDLARPHRQLRTRLQDAAATRDRSGRLLPGDRGDAKALRPRQREDVLLRPAMPARPQARRARRPVHSDLTPAATTTTPTGTPTATSSTTTTCSAGRDRPSHPRLAHRPPRTRPCSTPRSSSGGASSAASRPPSTRKGTGRDHNSYGFTMWMAGGGIKGGVSYGTTDELGSRAVENELHVKHLHATVLQQMGLDPNRLTYFHGGLDHKLVGVEGAMPIWDVIA